MSRCIFNKSLKMRSSVILLLGVFVVPIRQNQLGYYWREYSGTIPPDAVVGGEDADGTIVYIGQGYYRDHGLKPGKIISGVKQMVVPWNNNNKITSYTKILCGSQENFYWMKTDYENLYIQVANKHAVVGGHDDKNNDFLNIGRVIVNGTIHVGKVCQYWPDTSWMYYADGSNEVQVTTYEVLMYNLTTEDSTKCTKNAATGYNREMSAYLIWCVLLAIVFIQK